MIRFNAYSIKTKKAEDKKMDNTYFEQERSVDDVNVPDYRQWQSLVDEGVYKCPKCSSGKIQLRDDCTIWMARCLECGHDDDCAEFDVRERGCTGVVVGTYYNESTNEYMSYTCKCGDYRAGVKQLCQNCDAEYYRVHPHGWKAYPGDTCKHGIYTGGCMEDHMCPYCEMGDDRTAAEIAADTKKFMQSRQRINTLLVFTKDDERSWQVLIVRKSGDGSIYEGVAAATADAIMRHFLATDLWRYEVDGGVHMLFRKH